MSARVALDFDNSLDHPIGIFCYGFKCIGGAIERESMTYEIRGI
jgi:hypothetical protein